MEKRRSILSFVTELLLAGLLCAGGIGCLISGFGLDISPAAVAASMLFWPAVGVLCTRLRRGGWLVLGLSLGFWLYLLRGGLVTEGENLFLRVGRLLYQAYEFDLNGRFAAAGVKILWAPVGRAVLALTMLSGLGIGAAVGCGKSAWLCALPALLPLGLTLLVSDTVPGETWVFVLLLGLVLLALTQTLRRQDARQGARLMAGLLLPVALCTGFLLWCIPRAEYRPPELKDGLLPFLKDQAEALPFVGTDENGNLTLDGQSGDRVNLNRLGPRSARQRAAMWVSTNASGELYLRGRSFSDYDGLRWQMQADTGEEAFGLEKAYCPGGGLMLDGPMITTVEIGTRYSRQSCYVPYYPVGGVTLQQGRLDNPGREQNYTYDAIAPRADWQSYWKATHLMGSQPIDASMERYLALPQETRAWAQEMVETELKIFYQLAPFEVADRIAEFVRQQAEYDLNTQRMPRDRTDFARWFLEEAETGYCVHYATAAVVLLRAAHIPARYVEGYAVRIPAGGPGPVRVPMTITEDMAHAWVEYYVTDVGWIPLEATPAAGIRGPAETNGTGQTAGSTAHTQSTATRPTMQPGSTGASSVPVTQPPATGEPTVQPGTPQGPDLLGLWLSCGAVALVLLQWRVRLWFRRRKLRRGDYNRQALARWQYAVRLAGLCRQTPPAALLALAQRAKFSDHRLTASDLVPFDAYFTEAIARLRQCNLWKRVYHRLVLAAY